MSTDNNDMCANCGKGEEESVSLKKCSACMSVRYCSADCQKAHRTQHKQECRLRAVELHDEALFKQPPPREDCPICFLLLPSLHTGRRYKSCCGKIICSGCIHAITMTSGNNMCPFCRTPNHISYEELNEREKKRAEVGDTVAIHSLGCYYDEGSFDFPQDREKALEFWHRAAELGYKAAYNNIGVAYSNGVGVERDEKKAKHYYELAAMGGSEFARHNLGAYEANSGNMNRALKHFMIAVRSGDNVSLKTIQQLYSKGYVTKDDFAKALKAYQAYLDEVKSDDRDKAAAFSDDNRYY